MLIRGLERAAYFSARTLPQLFTAGRQMSAYCVLPEIGREIVGPSFVGRRALRDGASWSFLQGGASYSLHSTGRIIGSGGEKEVLSGTLTGPRGVQDVAILVNMLQSCFFDRLFFGGKKAEKQRQELDAKVAREERLLEEISGSEYVDRTSLVSPLHTEDGIVRVAPLARGSLETVLTGKITLPKALGILGDAARGLSFIHDREHVHSDIKPENILVSQGGRGMVTDIGCMGPLGSMEIGGTPGFQDPSRPTLDSKKPLLAKESDIYAFGLTILDVISPHEWSTTPEQRVLHLEIENLALTSIQANPLRRPTAREIAEELRRMDISAARL